MDLRRIGSPFYEFHLYRWILSFERSSEDRVVSSDLNHIEVCDTSGQDSFCVHHFPTFEISLPNHAFHRCFWIRFMLNYNFYLRIMSSADLITLFQLRYRVFGIAYYLKRLEGNMRSRPTCWPAFAKVNHSLCFASASVAHDAPLSQRFGRVCFVFYVRIAESQVMGTLSRMGFLYVFRKR